MLEKLGARSHSDRIRLLDFYSKTLEEYWKGKSGPEGLCSREMTDSWCCVCVGVLEVRLALV